MAKTIARDVTRDVVLILVVAGGIVSFFYNPLGGESIKYLQTLAGGIIGYYIGLREIPLAKAFKRNA